MDTRAHRTHLMSSANGARAPLDDVEPGGHATDPLSTTRRVGDSERWDAVWNRVARHLDARSLVCLERVSVRTRRIVASAEDAWRCAFVDAFGATYACEPWWPKGKVGDFPLGHSLPAPFHALLAVGRSWRWLVSAHIQSVTSGGALALAKSGPHTVHFSRRAPTNKERIIYIGDLVEGLPEGYGTLMLLSCGDENDGNRSPRRPTIECATSENRLGWSEAQWMGGSRLALLSAATRERFYVPDLPTADGEVVCATLASHDGRCFVGPCQNATPLRTIDSPFHDTGEPADAVWGRLTTCPSSLFDSARAHHRPDIDDKGACLLDLPDEVLIGILKCTETAGLLVVRATCRRLQEVVDGYDDVWFEAFARDHGPSFDLWHASIMPHEADTVKRPAKRQTLLRADFSHLEPCGRTWRWLYEAYTKKRTWPQEGEMPCTTEIECEHIGDVYEGEPYPLSVGESRCTPICAKRHFTYHGDTTSAACDRRWFRITPERRWRPRGYGLVTFCDGDGNPREHSQIMASVVDGALVIRVLSRTWAGGRRFVASALVPGDGVTTEPVLHVDGQGWSHARAEGAHSRDGELNGACVVYWDGVVRWRIGDFAMGRPRQVCLTAHGAIVYVFCETGAGERVRRLALVTADGSVLALDITDDSELGLLSAIKTGVAPSIVGRRLGFGNPDVVVALSAHLGSAQDVHPEVVHLCANYEYMSKDCEDMASAVEHVLGSLQGQLSAVVASGQAPHWLKSLMRHCL